MTPRDQHASAAQDPRSERLRGLLVGVGVGLVAFAIGIVVLFDPVGDRRDTEPELVLSDAAISVALEDGLGAADGALLEQEIRGLDGVASVRQARLEEDPTPTPADVPPTDPGGPAPALEDTLAVRVEEGTDVEQVTDEIAALEGVETVEWSGEGA